MYFITKRKSETGKKFQAISEKREIVFHAQKEFADKYGFDSWRASRFSVFGGISSCCRFYEPPNRKVWGLGDGVDEFFPKKSSKQGKEIFNEIKSLPIVSMEDLNECIGFNSTMFRTIGFAENNKIYFGFVVGNDWVVTVPEDCEEVTYTKYNLLFN